MTIESEKAKLEVEKLKLEIIKLKFEINDLFKPIIKTESRDLLNHEIDEEINEIINKNFSSRLEF